MTDQDLTFYVANWAAHVDGDSVPDEVRTAAKRHILDGYGLALSGRAEESRRLLEEHVVNQQSSPEALLLGTGVGVSAEAAALVNGLSMHAMDYDDTQLASDPESVYGLLTHPTTPVLSAATAVAELVNASGEDLLLAYIVGVEVACRVADAIPPAHYMNGFHTTGTAGVFGAAAAAGRLLGLSTAQMQTAFGIAAPLGGGFRANFGTMTKPLHAGQAGSGGVLAARLAQRGFTAAKSILEAPRGFYNASGGSYNESRIADCLGSPYFFTSPGISIKPYPSGSLSHPGQDAIIELANTHDVAAENVVAATAYTNSAMPTALIYALPQTGLEAKFSFPFCLAIGLLRRKAGIAEFRDEVVRSSEVQEMMQRCHHVADDEISARGFHTMETRVEVVMKDGNTFERTNTVATGHPSKPMTDAILQAKFLECCSIAIDSQQAAEAAELIFRLEEVDEAKTIHRTLASAVKPNA